MEVHILRDGKTGQAAGSPTGTSVEDDIDLLEGIFEAERDLEEGNGIPHEEVMTRLRARLSVSGRSAGPLFDARQGLVP